VNIYIQVEELKRDHSVGLDRFLQEVEPIRVQEEEVEEAEVETAEVETAVAV
jgi:hypothetical protein